MRAFSLVELSIVLVILGLLTGGILAGQSLIRAAELRSVTTEYTRWITATQTFRDKYFALPGDMNNATRFWGDDNAACPDAAIANGTPGTCNGNGDSNVISAVGISVPSESFQFWKHLALAGLIEGSYTGLSGTSGTGTYHAIIGTNVPASKVNNSGWSIHYFSSGTAGSIFNINYGNTFYFGTASAANLTSGNTLRPEEAWNIDTKIDDGKPGRGKVIARNISTCTDAGSGAGSENDFDATYLLSSTSIACALHFIAGF